MSTVIPRLSDTCDVAYAMSFLGGKWKVSIIWELADGTPKKFAQLRRKLVGVSEGVLIAQLKSLEQEGLVRRKAYPEVPPHVEYRLTETSRQLIPILRRLELWGAHKRNSSL